MLRVGKGFTCYIASLPLILCKNSWPAPPSLSLNSDCEFFFCKRTLAALMARMFLLVWDEASFSGTFSFDQGSTYSKTQMPCIALWIFKERQPHPPSPTIHVGHPGCAVTGSSTTGQKGSSLNIHSLNTSKSGPFETQIGLCPCLPDSDLSCSFSSHSKWNPQVPPWPLRSCMNQPPIASLTSSAIAPPISPSTPAPLAFLITHGATPTSGPLTCCSWGHRALPSLHQDLCSDIVSPERPSVPPNWK